MLAGATTASGEVQRPRDRVLADQRFFNPTTHTIKNSTMGFSARFRSVATTSRNPLKIGMIPADGIGREVLPVWLQFSGSATSLPL